MRDLREGDVLIEGSWVVEYHGEHSCAGGTIESNGRHEPYCGFEPRFLVKDMTAIERASAVNDPTAELGTPEMVYRKALPGESERDKSKRLRAESRQQARNVIIAALGSDEDLLDMLQEVLLGFRFKNHGPGAIDFWNDEINYDMIIKALREYLLEEPSE